MTANPHTDRSDKVSAKAAEWRDQLVDLNYRNTLLYFRDSMTGSLELTAAEPDALADLETGTRVSLRRLFPDADHRADALDRARATERKIGVLRQEQGIDVGRVAFGLIDTASMPQSRSRPTPALRSPLVLRSVTLRATASDRDITLEFDDDPEFNPVLLYALATQYDVDVEHTRNRLDRILSKTADRSALMEQGFSVLSTAAAASGVTLGFTPAVVLGTFGYEKMPMVEDLTDAQELLATNDLIAALAGDGPARESIRLDAAAYSDITVDEITPSDEFLVHDANSSQHKAIAAALAGQHVYLEGPPGTGKSQTIANIIAGAAAIGKTVLFVAEKRAAIDAVMDKLAAVGLDELVLDLHHDHAAKREIARQLHDSLERLSNHPPGDNNRIADIHTRLTRTRARLLNHSRQLHLPRAPWDISVFDLRSCLQTLPDHDLHITFHGSLLRTLTADVVQDLEQDLHDFVRLGGLEILRGESPWSDTSIRTPHEAEQLLDQLDDVADRMLHRSREGMRKILGQTGIAVPDDVAGWQDVLTLFDGVAMSIAAYGPNIFGAELDAYLVATAPREQRRHMSPAFGWWHRHQLVEELRAKAGQRLDKAALHTALSRIAQQRNQWSRLSNRTSRPMRINGLESITHDYIQLRTTLAAVATSTHRSDLTTGTVSDLERRLAQLREHKDMLFRIPQLNMYLDRFEKLGLRPFLDKVAHHNPTAEQTWQSFQRAWLTSINEDCMLHVPEIGTFVSDQMTRAVDEFRTADLTHQTLAAQRIRYRVAQHARQARDTHPGPTQLLKQQAARRSGHLTPRALVAQAHEVLLALRPCWTMSPLIVSRILPAKRLFDLVVFDEASQIRPHDAITSLMRGHRVVAAGDEKQLPPTDFFERTMTQEDTDEDSDDNLTDYESILTTLRALLPRTRCLTWHYRSIDERLITVSNQDIYNNTLVTFPGPTTDSPVRLVRVDGQVSPGQNGSSPAEVDKVVALILDHAAHRPAESLGVITLNAKHQARVERSLALARADHPESNGFFTTEGDPRRRFFIKNIETVQGDERDAIILSIGVGRPASGKLSRNSFGPLNRRGSERRVNVAVTRAARRMTVVAALCAADLTPGPMNGTELLRRYLEFAENQGCIDNIGSLTDRKLNGFEQAVYDALRAEDVPVYPQWGVSGHCIDFVLAHPDQPGRMVLAVETDGHRYHSSASARDRDRLRQAHLERLRWRFHRLWSSAWFHDPRTETDNILAAWHDAIAAADSEPHQRSPEYPPTPMPGLPTRSLPKPPIHPGMSIDNYSQPELVAYARWHISDGRQLDRDQRLTEIMQDLGFRRRGTKIVTHLTAAIDAAQRHADEEE